MERRGSEREVGRVVDSFHEPAMGRVAEARDAGVADEYAPCHPIARAEHMVEDGLGRDAVRYDRDVRVAQQVHFGVVEQNRHLLFQPCGCAALHHADGFSVRRTEVNAELCHLSDDFLSVDFIATATRPVTRAVFNECICRDDFRR